MIVPHRNTAKHIEFSVKQDMVTITKEQISPPPGNVSIHCTASRWEPKHHLQEEEAKKVAEIESEGVLPLTLKMRVCMAGEDD